MTSYSYSYVRYCQPCPGVAYWTCTATGSGSPASCSGPKLMYGGVHYSNQCPSGGFSFTHSEYQAPVSAAIDEGFCFVHVDTEAQQTAVVNAARAAGYNAGGHSRYGYLGVYAY